MEILVSLLFWFHLRDQGGCLVVQSAGEPRTGAEDPWILGSPDRADGRTDGTDWTDGLDTCDQQLSVIQSRKSPTGWTGRAASDVTLDVTQRLGG